MKLTDTLRALKPFVVSKRQAIVLVPAAMLLIAPLAYDRHLQRFLYEQVYPSANGATE